MLAADWIAVLLLMFFFESFRVWGTIIGFKLKRIAGCPGLRRESIDYLDIQQVETLMVVILPVFALPFAIGFGREERMYRFVAAVIVLIVYVQLIEQGAIATQAAGISPYITMWGPTVAFTAFAIWRFWSVCFRVGRERLFPRLRFLDAFDREARRIWQGLLQRFRPTPRHAKQ